MGTASSIQKCKADKKRGKEIKKEESSAPIGKQQIAKSKQEATTPECPIKAVHSTPAVPTPPTNPEENGTSRKKHQELLDLIRSSNFDVMKYENTELISLIAYMFDDLAIVKELGITTARLRRWLVAVEKNYNKVHFHNFRHAFCVTQMMYVLIHKMNLIKVMTKIHLGILMVACVCHDLDHPGLSNAYHKKARTELSILYDNKSVLEHHHCAIAFKLLAVTDLNIFINIEPKQFAEISHVIIQLILATDMEMHSQILTDFQSRVKEGFDLSHPEHLLVLLKILIKCCDISNEVRPLHFSERWVNCLFKEFFAQANRERQEGMQVIGYLDKSTVRRANNQLVFIRGIIMPLFECVVKVFPDVKCEILTSLRESECYYERMSEADIPETMLSSTNDTEAESNTCSSVLEKKSGTLAQKCSYFPEKRCIPKIQISPPTPTRGPVKK